MIVNQDNFVFLCMLQCYILSEAQNGKVKQIEVINCFPRLILKWGIRKCQYFDPKLPTFGIDTK